MRIGIKILLIIIIMICFYVVIFVIVIFMNLAKRRERYARVFGCCVEIVITEEYFEYDVVNPKSFDSARGFETSNGSVILNAAVAGNFRSIDTLKHVPRSNPKSRFYAYFNFKASINLVNIEYLNSNRFIRFARAFTSKLETATDCLKYPVISSWFRISGCLFIILLITFLIRNFFIEYEL